MKTLPLISIAIVSTFSCTVPTTPYVQTYDIIIRNGTVYDGSGGDSVVADIGINSDTIAFIGTIGKAVGRKEIDATNLVVAPGFINMLSWAHRDLVKDGRSMSDIKQGVTLEIFGEGWSPGPHRLKNKDVDTAWHDLATYFDYLSSQGISTNVASFVGHTSVRNMVLQYDNRKPSEAELLEMKKLVAEAMEQGAWGLGSSLIYPPASYSDTQELVELAKEAARYQGIYISHIRSEGDGIVDALKEAFTIGKEANLPVEIYHLKISQARNWQKLDTLITLIDSMQNQGVRITANMYPYIASGTGLVSRLPDWVQEGGLFQMRKRLRTSFVRKRVLYEMANGIPTRNSDPKDVLLIHFKQPHLNDRFKGKRLDEVARLWGKSADETVVDLLLEDESRIEALYFLQSEENLRQIMQLPYVSFGSDASSVAIESVEGIGTHPRAYGTFARVLSYYVREKNILTLSEAVRKMTALPATNLGIHRRGKLNIGYFADIVIFDPLTIRDHADFNNPHQYATGVEHVLVNGVPVIRYGEHTGAKPGRVIYGHGKKE